MDFSYVFHPTAPALLTGASPGVVTFSVSGTELLVNGCRDPDGTCRSPVSAGL